VPEFAGDLPEAEQQLVWSTQMAPLADLFDQPVPGAAWQHKPTSYIVGSNDRTIQPELQRFLAARMKAKVTEVASSHVPHALPVPACLRRHRGCRSERRAVIQLVRKPLQPGKIDARLG